MIVRAASEADLPGIAQIYDREVLDGIATFMTEPYTPERWRQWLGDHARPRHPVVVAAEGPRVLGWASLSVWSPRQAYDRTVESSVYVHPAAQGRGIGRALMADLLERGGRGGACVVIARVVDQNPASVRFHELLGFTTVGVMRRIGEKFGRLLDVRIMDLHLDAGAHEP
jgi:L-amino acid N-acyltransferase